jgi:hypothetical protein
LFRELAGSLLLAHGRIDLAGAPDLARAQVGDDLWELIRPDAEVPHDRQDPGMPRDAIERAIADLERMT